MELDSLRAGARIRSRRSVPINRDEEICMPVYTPEIPELGQPCPDFRLPGVDGHSYSKEDLKGAKAALVMFICNHCPYVQAVEDRLIGLGAFFRDQPVRILAICSNDSETYPEDGFDQMKTHAYEKNYTFPYLRDESQEAARGFGAICTPDFFLYDSDLNLSYRGRLDDSWKDPSRVQRQELKSAIEALLRGERPPARQMPSMGCSIKWKRSPASGSSA